MAMKPRARQSGEALILTLLVLVVLYLGFLYTMRYVMTDAQMAGNNLAQQKNTQSADIALRRLQTMVLQASNLVALEFSATGQAWYRTVAPGTAAPDAAYWRNCLGNASSNARCGTVEVKIGNTVLPFTARAVVQPTDRRDLYACPLGNIALAANYYDVFLNIQESSAATSATTETVIKLCVQK
ncbi:Tfp pilus assembly protein PilX [Paucibacter oligotrophus]|uniref:Tfp pilus assembly protein PilX n=1 Tax=Roseateles oligotrophus TaxID=1769250 RepID=A0A840L891_9BURK|nr:hypothetical protein [Roseateles oligotrophus]MBB4844774.1 Tfp pilus assembly protein PilX [Roseateles oligotrophus]